MKKAMLLLTAAAAALLFAGCNAVTDDAAEPYEDDLTSFALPISGGESVEAAIASAFEAENSGEDAVVLISGGESAEAKDAADVSALPFGEKTYRGNVAVYRGMDDGYFGLSYIGQSTLWNKKDVAAEGGYKVFETEDGQIYAVAFVSGIDGKLYVQTNTGDVYPVCD